VGGGGGGGGGAADADRFDEFWSAYPRHTAKQTAVKAWRKLNPAAELVATILAALERQKQSTQWRQGVIPHAATWLNQSRWEDEIPPAGKPRMRFDGLREFAGG
jgi:hypothetical protein